jgi:hypothetical protein
VLEFSKPLKASAWEHLGATVSSFHLELFLALMGVSYVVGHLLFRQDIKEPDRKSFIRTHSPRISKLDAFRRGLVRLFGSEARFPIYWGAEDPITEALAPSQRRRTTVQRLWSQLSDACWPVIPVLSSAAPRETDW